MRCNQKTVDSGRAALPWILNGREASRSAASALRSWTDGAARGSASAGLTAWLRRKGLDPDIMRMSPSFVHGSEIGENVDKLHNEVSDKRDNGILRDLDQD